MRNRILGLCAAAACFASAPAIAQPVNTTFTYQGSVTTGGVPANGTFDVQFMLFDAATGGTQIGTTNCYDSVAIANGLLTSTLNFGNAFTAGATRFLQIGIRADTTPGNCGSGSYTVLSPRQELTGAPTSIGLRIPFSGGETSATDLFVLNNGGTGSAISCTGQGQQAILGSAGAQSGGGVKGQNNPSGAFGVLGYGSWGVYGQSFNSYGVFGDSSAQSFSGIFGRNESTTGLAPGGQFVTLSSTGVGASGSAQATTGSGIGLSGSSAGPAGIGVQGVATGTTGFSYGVYGSCATISGAAVYGTNSATGCYGSLGGDFGVEGYSPNGYGISGQTADSGYAGVYGDGPAYGGYFTSPDTGVHGEASGITGSGVGVWGTSTYNNGTGVYGQSYTQTGPGTGVFGRSDSVEGTGVLGLAFASSGVNYGVYGSSTSPNGYGGYFEGKGYFSGFVGLGTQSPAVPLQIVGGTDLSLTDGGNIVMGQVGAANLAMDNNEIQARNNGAAASLYINANGGNVAIGAGSAQGFQLLVSGTAAKPGGGSWSTTSDARLKKNIQPLNGTLDKLLQLRGVTFEYLDPKSINELSGTRTGMIAQEVEQVFPDWVDQGPDGMRRLTFRGFEALTVEALRDLRTETTTAQKATQARVESLEQENCRLKQELADLRAAVDALTARQTAAR